MTDAERLIRTYYDAFDRGDRDAMLALLTDDVVHDINQGSRETGRDAFAAFMARMDRCYRERLSDIVVMTDSAGTRASAEYVVHGTYLATDEGLPKARGQTYTLPGGAFFALRDGRIARVTNFYNLEDWLGQVARPTVTAPTLPQPTPG
ncbi:ketosteroid isomerase-related protein [Roseomonas sp. CCTCC AB2023176]|uniref:ketosteroid isomerase-related protein n=1 Tax=Roseomonas sp. CCTCC AB2023176 TaxID=3342640 RepID=UPI0035E2C569